MKKLIIPCLFLLMVLTSCNDEPYHIESSTTSGITTTNSNLTQQIPTTTITDNTPTSTTSSNVGNGGKYSEPEEGEWEYLG